MGAMPRFAATFEVVPPSGRPSRKQLRAGLWRKNRAKMARNPSRKRRRDNEEGDSYDELSDDDEPLAPVLSIASGSCICIAVARN